MIYHLWRYSQTYVTENECVIEKFLRVIDSLALPVLLTYPLWLRAQVSKQISCSIIFTALHVMQTRYCDEISVCLSVRPSVRPSVCHTRGL